jgi:SAM-dependent methyltransferase
VIAAADSTPSAPAFRPTLARSRALFRAFGLEQTDPDHFYGMVAQDSAAHLASYTPLAGKVMLDVGGGPGYFADAFRAAGATYFALDADAGELSLHGRSPERGSTVLGSGLQLPFKSGSIDVCFSSNVLEHVPDPWMMADEMVRVTKPGGTVFLSYTTWLSPHGGHETSPWHYLGGKRALARFTKTHGKPPKNIFGESMYAVSVHGALKWTRKRTHDGTVELVEAFPRYHPRWAYRVVNVPGVREFLTWNLVLVLRKR